MRDFYLAVDGSNLIDGFDFGGEATMHAEDTAINDGTDGKVVEHLRAIFPWVGIPVLSVDFIIEPVHCGDLSGFVVAPEEGDSIGVLDFEA